jgi:hypothetical protein
MQAKKTMRIWSPLKRMTVTNCWLAVLCKTIFAIRDMNRHFHGFQDYSHTFLRRLRVHCATVPISHTLRTLMDWGYRGT